MKKHKGCHPLVNEFKSDMDGGKLSRREFLRYAGLLGVSAAAATQLAGLALPRKVFAASGIQRGGMLRIASPVQKVTHPAQISWTEPSNQLRQVAEYLTWTDGENITHPYLLENWAASDDLKTWTLNLRRGVSFNNGDAFNADDVVFTLNQWLDKNVGSSMLGMMGTYLKATGIEKVGPHQVRLHLDKPEIAVPEHFFHYPALVLNHRTFEGDFIKKPHGTGPYTLEVYAEGERCVVKRREGYWQKGADGKALPYMDGMEFIDMGTEMAPQITALRSGEIDIIDLSRATGVDVYQALKDDPNMNILPIPTARAQVLRMRADVKPWSDNRVRTALKLCQHREKILALAFFGQGLLGHDCHVYPNHPEYCKKPVPKYDPEAAKKLLAEAGYPQGLDVTLTIPTSSPDIVRYAEILKQDATPAGFRITIRTIPDSQYWEKWTEVDLGITSWTHRPLGTMVLNLGYIADADGKPVPWNETRWVDKEFNELVKQANGTLDVEKRREIFCKIEDIQMERGSVGIAYWRNSWFITRKRVQDVPPQSTLLFLFNEVWLKD
ncbi:ABC transporter substrate-binding protein [Desulfonema ishimotonii]|uniref:ABC transporter substrate-binding protein n=1 Tax=Desulfonema ishimotonii TaxID=45657 RepID=A0A401FY79_9BACT|nr:ABC transporter substrate-binding protein [Desulfonema ishimotonii]GBC61928.1 ABC transporter substrate-binding protein [Desulfonema ishimotonii]